MATLKTDQKELQFLFDEMAKMPEIYRPSKFWTDLNKVHEDQILYADLSNFQRSINVRYFNWRILPIIRHQTLPMLRSFFKGNFDPVFKSTFINPRVPGVKNITHFNPLAAIIYRIYVASLYEFVKKGDHRGLLEKIDEPELGNPFKVMYKGRVRTQDLCNSVHEFYSVFDHVPVSGDKIHVAELGQGYGRTAHVILKALPQATYCAIDIPAALYVAQEYLSKVFEGEKIFKYRPFTSFEEVREEFNAARIKFLMPHQMALLPKDCFSVFVNISSIHEMTIPQIENYTNQIDRVCDGYFYTKQWRTSRVKDNGYIKMGEYPTPPAWSVVAHHNRHPIQNMFFDTVYKTRKTTE